MNKLEEVRRAWDREAASFDQDADHGLRDPHVRDAWRTLLLESLPLPGVSATFAQGDAGEAGLTPGSFDVVLCRHVLWALPDPDGALGRWVSLLAPGGRLVLVEGSWYTGAGLTASESESFGPQAPQRGRCTSPGRAGLLGSQDRR